MNKFVLAAVFLFLTYLVVNADEIERPEELRPMLTLTPSDYVANMTAWRPVTGESLSNFVSHRFWGGYYIEQDPILGQTSGLANIFRVKRNRITSRSEGESRPDRGELILENDQYCVYWKGYGKLCYRVLYQKIQGKPAYLITRENGDAAFGIEVLQE